MASLAAGTAGLSGGGADPQLRSTNAVTGCDIHARDGEIGYLAVSRSEIKNGPL